MKLSVIVNAKNEEGFIADCLESVKWADEILVILSQLSEDKTKEIAQKFDARIIPQEPKEIDFAAWHNQGVKEAEGDWLFWLDADERITPSIEEEIRKIIKDSKEGALAIPRRNFLLGKELKHGGWYPDYQIRIFRKEKLKKWVGKLHEHPEFEGEVKKLKEPMIHLQPEKLEPALVKSIKWSGIEAKLLEDANHPKIVCWRVLRMGATTLFERLVKKQGFLDGVEGWIESLYQAFHTMIVYLKLWERQLGKVVQK